MLARLYRDTSGSALLGLEQLKKLSVALLKHSSAEAAAALSKVAHLVACAVTEHLCSVSSTMWQL